MGGNAEGWGVGMLGNAEGWECWGRAGVGGNAGKPTFEDTPSSNILSSSIGVKADGTASSNILIGVKADGATSS